MAPVTAQKKGRRESETNDLTPPEPRARSVGSGTILRASLAVSVLLHAGLLLGIQQAFPVIWLNRPLRTFEVELFRPPVDPSSIEEGEGSRLAAARAAEETSPQDAEATISLDTKDRRYGSYARVIKERIAAHWKYPSEAKKNLIEGEVLLLFSLSPPGELTDLQVLASSGAPVLDQEAARAVRAASPFPPFPGSVSVKRLHIKADFSYRLQTRP
jgi:TonB family protein